MFLVPENEYVNKLIYDIFQSNDYTKLHINPKFNYINIIEELDEKLKLFIIYENVKDLISRAKQVINGEIKYEKKREFTTNQISELNIINQHGDLEYYSRNVLQMKKGGTNRQSTGIFEFSNKIITIFVDANNNGPLPSIYFSQYLGKSTDWLSSPIHLQKEKML